MMRHERGQSAMEYLMTYGWSILIIAIVLGALYSLGVFSSSNLGPRAQPNSCRVYRPNGIGTSTNVNLEGTCNGELPKFVLEETTGGQPFQVANVGSVFPTISSTSGSITITEWVYLPSASGDFAFICSTAACNTDPQLETFVDGSCTGNQFLPIMYLTSGWRDECNQPNPIPTNQWIFLGASFNNTALGGYVGAAGTIYTDCCSASAYMTGSNTLVPGIFYPFYSLNAGTEVSNVQVYDRVLDANTIQALYLEGIGGAPVAPEYLIGWWPLNGDDNDYSGEGLNGNTIVGAAFVSSWATSYSAP